MGEETTVAEWVEKRIHAIFTDLAESYAVGEMDFELTDDEASGLPMALMKADMWLTACWKQFVGASND